MIVDGYDFSEFIKAVKKYFSFLVDEYKFSVEEERVYPPVYCFMFRKNNIFVNVFYRADARELELSFGLNKPDSSSELYGYNIVELSMISPKVMKAWEKEQEKYSKESKLGRSVILFSYILKNAAVDFLNGDFRILDELKIIKDERIARNQLETKIEPLRKKADLAWEEKEYKKIILICEKETKNLTPLQLKRLEYAKKQVD